MCFELYIKLGDGGGCVGVGHTHSFMRTVYVMREFLFLYDPEFIHRNVVPRRWR